jgi:hypothetical protein
VQTRRLLGLGLELAAASAAPAGATRFGVFRM